MPTAAPRVCSGCRQVVHGPCARCTARRARVKATRDRQRPNAAARGYGTDWRQLRPQILARDPVCVACGKRPSVHADHVVPRAQGGTDDPANLQGVCHPCHSRKTAQQDGGFGNPIARGGQLRAASMRAAR